MRMIYCPWTPADFIAYILYVHIASIFGVPLLHFYTYISVHDGLKTERKQVFTGIDQSGTEV